MLLLSFDPWKPEGHNAGDPALRFVNGRGRGGPRGLAHSVAKVLGGRTARPVIASPAIRHTRNELNRGRPSMANLFPKSILAALLIKQFGS